MSCRKYSADYRRLASLLALRLVFVAIALVANIKSGSAQQNDSEIRSRLKIQVDRSQQSKDLEEQITALEEALRLVPQVRQWTFQAPRLKAKGLLLHQLGVAYLRRQLGDANQNTETAIKALRSAFESLTREDAPSEWASSHNNYAAALIDRDRNTSTKDNQELALNSYLQALTVWTLENSPQRWADVQINRGNIFLFRKFGVRLDNLMEAVNAYKAASTVYTSDNKEQWGMIQRGLGATLTKIAQETDLLPFATALAAVKSVLASTEGLVEPNGYAILQAHLGELHLKESLLAVWRG